MCSIRKLVWILAGASWIWTACERADATEITISGPSPGDEATLGSLNPTLSVTVRHPHEDSSLARPTACMPSPVERCSNTTDPNPTPRATKNGPRRSVFPSRSRERERDTAGGSELDEQSFHLPAPIFLPAPPSLLVHPRHFQAWSRPARLPRSSDCL